QAGNRSGFVSRHLPSAHNLLGGAVSNRGNSPVRTSAWLRAFCCFLTARWRLLCGKESVMAKLISYYVPASYRKKTRAWTPQELRAKVIVSTPASERKSA